MNTFCTVLVACGAGIALPFGCAGDHAVAPSLAAAPSQKSEIDAALVRTEALRHLEEEHAEGFSPTDQPDEAAEFFLQQRLRSGETEYPLDDLASAMAEVRGRQNAAAAGDGGGALFAEWSNIGPGNIGGRTRAFVIDPTSPDTMYAGGVDGGVWKSADAGASWINTDDFLLNLAVSTLALDPNDPSVIYAGTGEGFGSPSTYIRGNGIYKSVDAGGTWTPLLGTIEGVPDGAFDYVNKVVVSANDSSRVYAATRHGVWRSLDAGATWSIVLSNPVYAGTPPFSNGSGLGCTDLAIRPGTNPDQLWAAFGSFESDGVFRSDNGGNSWIPYTVPSNQGRMTFAFAPSDSNVMYILMADNGTGGQAGQLVNVYRSLNGGLTFEGRVNFDAPMGPWLLSNYLIASGCIEYFNYSQGWHDNIIKVDPIDPNIVWVGGVEIFRSEDGGANWGIAGYWAFSMQDPVPPYQVHADHHNIVFHPNYDGVLNQTMWVTNDGGLFRTSNARAVTSQEDCPLPPHDPLPEIVWQNMNVDYITTQFYHGDSARDVDVFIGGAQDNGTSRGIGTNDPNGWDSIFGGDGGYVAIDPIDSRNVFVEVQFFPNIYKSTDGGEVSALAVSGITDTDGVFIPPFAMDQNDPRILWTGGSRPWRTINGAASWTAAGPDFGAPGQITAVGIAPSDSNVVYLGFDNGYVVRTTNGLDPSPNWQVFSNGLYGAWVSSVAVDPGDPDTAYVTYSTFGIPHVLRTTNGGLSWVPIDDQSSNDIPDMPAHWVAVRPCDAQQLFVGTELGVFATSDGGANWYPINDGLANVVVETVDFKNHHTPVAFTHGRGAFVGRLLPCASCPADIDGDGDADFADLLSLLAAWGPCANCAADVDRDGTVGFTDLVALLSGWGECEA